MLHQHCLSPPLNPQCTPARRGTRTQETGDVHSASSKYNSGSWKRELTLHNQQDDKLLRNKHHQNDHHLTV